MACEHRLTREGGIVDCVQQCLGNGNRCEIGAARECPGVNTLNKGRDNYRGQPQIGELGSRDGGESWGDFETLENRIAAAVGGNGGFRVLNIRFRRFILEYAGNDSAGGIFEAAPPGNALGLVVFRSPWEMVTDLRSGLPANALGAMDVTPGGMVTDVKPRLLKAKAFIAVTESETWRFLPMMLPWASF